MMQQRSETCLAEVSLIDMAELLHSAGSFVFLTGTLYREVQVKNPHCARFSLKNNKGLFFVKVYQAALIEKVKRLVPGAQMSVVGEMHSFVSRRCKNHHVFVKAVALSPVYEAGLNWKVGGQKGRNGFCDVSQRVADQSNPVIKKSS